MARHAASKGTNNNMMRHVDDLVMTRQQFKESPVWTLTGLDKPIKIKDRGNVKWVVLETEQYEKLLSKLEELCLNE